MIQRKESCTESDATVVVRLKSNKFVKIEKKEEKRKKKRREKTLFFSISLSIELFIGRLS